MTKNKEETKYVQHKNVCNMQRRHVALGNNPNPPPPNISQSSLKTPDHLPPTPHSSPQNSAHTHRTSRNTITSLSLLVWKKVKHCETPNPPPPASSSPPSSVKEGGRGLGAVVPLVHLGIVHLDRVEELVSVEAAHSVEDVAQHGHSCVAARGRHATQHPPLVAGGVVHLHAAERMGAVESADNEQFSWN